MSASTRALLTTREAKTGKTGNSSSQANKANLSPIRNTPVDQISFLQRTVGNRGVERLLKSGLIQAKLKVNEPGDIYEQEADRVAGQVLATPTHAPVGGTASRIQRVTGQPAGETTSAPASVERALASPGQPFEPALRQEMEQRFGHDFSRVRVHSGTAAEQSAQDVNADAYTVGHNMVFGAGRFAPSTHVGRRLIVHELTHVLQQDEASPTIQRQPVKPQEKSKFDFMLGDVEGKQRVMAILSPSNPADFLDAFEEKGNELITAYFAWLSNNLVQFAADSVVKKERNPFANIDVDTMRELAGKGYDKAIAALAVRGAEEAGGFLLKAITGGRKVRQAITKVRTFGGILAWVGAALIQALIGPLFDKSKELVKQAVAQFAEAVKRVNNETIIPKVGVSTRQFTKFIATLKEYLLQDEEDPKPKAKAKSRSTEVSIGEGDYQMTIGIETSAEFTERRRDQIMLDLANVVLGIDEVMPTLKSDLSMYKDLAVKAKVFSGKATEASKPSSAKPFTPTYSQKFRFGQNLVGKTKFHVPQGASVIVESDARYDMETAGMPEDMRPPKKYTIEIYRVNTNWRKGDRPVGTARQFEVTKTESAEWPALDDGEYYLVISKGGNPSFMLEGDVRIEVRPRESGQK